MDGWRICWNWPRRSHGNPILSLKYIINFFRLWVVIIAGLLIPIILISIFCFGRKTTKPDHKKTDEPIEDEPMEEVNQEEYEEQQMAAGEEDGGEATQPSTNASSTTSSAKSSKPSTPVVEKKKNKKKTEEVHDQIDEPQPSTSGVPPESHSPQPTKRVRARRQD